MRLSVVLPCFFKNTDFCDSIRAIASLGYDCAELWGWDGIDPDAAKQVLSETGVELVSLCTTDFRLNDPSCRQSFLDGLKKTCEFASKVGATHVLTQVGNDTGEPRDLQRASIIEGLRAARPILEQYGIVLIIEPLSVPVYFLQHSADAFDIVRAVDSPLVKVVFDIYHQQITEGNIIPNITENVDCIAHLHGAGHPGRNEFETGENNYHIILRAAQDAGFKGVIGLEYRPSVEPMESLKRTMELFSG